MLSKRDVFFRVSKNILVLQSVILVSLCYTWEESGLQNNFIFFLSQLCQRLNGFSLLFCEESLLRPVSDCLLKVCLPLNTGFLCCVTCSFEYGE